MNNAKNIEAPARAVKAKCDIYHTAERVELRLEMPGVADKNLDVRIDDDLLIIRGTRSETEEKGKFLLHEIRGGDYYNEFTLDDTIDRENVEASIKNGIVTLVLGIKESVKPRKIEVKAG